jgi:nitroreductase
VGIVPPVDVHLAVASKRDVRRYAGRPVGPEAERRILDAGRLAGSARNRQPCRFVVVEGEAVAAVAATVYSPWVVQAAGLVVVLTVTPGGGLVDFDAGRAAQSMMLQAWGDGIASCPNGIADREGLRRVLGLEGEERAVIVLSFGEPEDVRDPARRPAEEWSARALRLPLERLVRRVGSAAP